ncbi:hypothetical protein ANCCAN_12978, partial [Ancylostoma caninum]
MKILAESSLFHSVLLCHVQVHNDTGTRTAGIPRIVSYDDNPDKCTMPRDVRDRIKAYHKQVRPPPRGDFDGPYYECLLEGYAKLKQENSSYSLPSHYDMIEVVFDQRSIYEKLDEAFKSLVWEHLKKDQKRLDELEVPSASDQLLQMRRNSSSTFTINSLLEKDGGSSK